MPKFKVLFGDEYDDEVFDSEEEAEDYAIDMAACIREGLKYYLCPIPGITMKTIMTMNMKL